MNQRALYILLSVSLAVTLLALPGCGPTTGGSRASGLAANQPDRRGTLTERFQSALDGRGGDRRSIGTDDFLGDTARGRDLIVPSGDGGFSLNLVNVPIEQAADAVFGQALRRPYTIAPEVSGTVTLQTSRPLSGQELLETFQTVLEFNGATIRSSGDTITIVPLAGAARRVAGVGDGGVGARVVAVPLEFIGTAEMTRLLEPIAGSSIRLQPIPNRNILLIAGSRDEINAAIDAINVFDVDILRGKSVGLYKLRAAEPEAIVEELNQIFETAEGGSLQNVVTFVPSQRLGAVLVITSRSNYLQQAERWIRDLDSAAGGTRRRPVVYDLQSRSAAELAPILSEMLDDVAENDTGQIESKPRVVADDARNAIVVWGNDSEQELFSRLIQSLDTAPVQVLLEATIAEVSLNDELNFGLRWFFENGDFSGRFTDVASGSVGASSPGLSFMFQGASASVTLNALNSVTDVQVVSSPSLMVVDNHEARLQIGDQVPIATQQVRDTTDPNAPVVNTISFRDTGIILTVKPRVSAAGQVVLDIEQEVSSVKSTTTSGIDSPTISQRKIRTSIVVGDGQTVALGGLIQESNNRTNARVPGAGNVPVVGALFRNRRDAIARTELLVLITPRVLRNSSDSAAAAAELRRRIQGANGVAANGISDPGVGHRIMD